MLDAMTKEIIAGIHYIGAQDRDLDLFESHYGILHTLSIDDAVDDLQVLCLRNGGKIG